MTSHHMKRIAIAFFVFVILSTSTTAEASYFYFGISSRPYWSGLVLSPGTSIPYFYTPYNLWGARGYYGTSPFVSYPSPTLRERRRLQQGTEALLMKKIKLYYGVEQTIATMNQPAVPSQPQINDESEKNLEENLEENFQTAPQIQAPVGATQASPRQEASDNNSVTIRYY